MECKIGNAGIRLEMIMVKIIIATAVRVGKDVGVQFTGLGGFKNLDGLSLNWLTNKLG